MLPRLAIILLISACYYAQDSPIVETPLGTIMGYYGTTYDGKKYMIFEGIPYAKPPLDERRFEEPQAVEPWVGVLNATSGSTCAQTLQVFPQIVVGDEDCLHINVYVPREEINTEEKLEVVVHIHGGSFMYGSSIQIGNPSYAMDRDIILVTFNYRLGILGFLSTEDDVVPGNNGLKDQVLALKWIQQNIASFGGNPDSVTLTGMSSGSSSVHLHYFSELSVGLFHRGLAQSGVALNPFSIVEGGLEKAQKLADSLNCSSDKSRDFVDCLKLIPYQNILQKMELFFGYKFLPSDPFGPVVEKSGSNPFISENPYILLTKGQLQDLPLITSNVIHEGLLFVNYATGDDLIYIDSHWDDLAPVLLDFNYTLPESSWVNASEEIRKYYLNDTAINLDSKMVLVQAVSDRYFLCGAETAVRLQASVIESPVYYYIFGYPGDNNPDQTVSHGIEMKYLYGIQYLTEDELKMKDLLWDMIISYAKTNVPTFGDIEWKPTTYQEDIYLQIDGTGSDGIKLLSVEELTNRQFWNSLNFEENENLVSSTT